MLPAMISNRRACTAAAVGNTPSALSMMDIVVLRSKLSEIHFVGNPAAKDVPTSFGRMQNACSLEVYTTMSR
jgi:hypothetical protein